MTVETSSKGGLITRPADEFEPGDRVYVVDGDPDTLPAGQICVVDTRAGKMVHLRGQNNFGWNRSRFLRVIEAGETIPKGTVTRTIVAAGVSEDYTHGREWLCCSDDRLLVLVSLPEPDETTQNDVSHPATCNDSSPPDENPDSDPVLVEVSNDIREVFKEALAATPFCNLACGSSEPSPDAILQAAATIYAAWTTEQNPTSADNYAVCVHAAQALARLINQPKDTK